MARKKVTLAWIANNGDRKASLKKRRLGLLKKVSELSTLCDIDACVIIYSPDEREPMLWPPQPQVQEMLARFFSIPELERNKKMMNQETYLRERLSKVQEQFKKHQRKHKEMEISNLMHHVYQRNGVDDLNVADLQSLVWFVEEKRKEIKRRMEYCQQCSLPLAASHQHSAPTTHEQAPLLVSNQMASNIGDGHIDGADHDHYVKDLVESGVWDQWFVDMMNNSENIAESSSRARTDNMARLSAGYQPLAISSYGANQFGLAGSSSANETVMGFQRLSSGGSDVPMLHPPALLQGNYNSTAGNVIGFGMQPYGAYRGLGTSASDMAIGLPPPHFASYGNANDVASGMQPFGNVVEANNRASGGDQMDLQPSQFYGGSIDGNDIGFPKP